MGKFGDDNVWQKWMDKETVCQVSRSAQRLLLIWMVLVWCIADDLPNSPNFPMPNLPAIRYLIDTSY